MKITNLDVQGFGVWSGLKIERLSDGLNVFYGPNEAGKTTLLQFIRSMLYGFSPERRHYLPPVHGGPAGGTVEVAGGQGRFQINRLAATADGSTTEQLTLTAPDGTRQGEHFVKVLLSNVDESVFNNVFAVGLREIQELATLGDTEAAELLYSLTAGLDRVSLVEVIGELAASRNRVLDSDGRPSQIVQLLADREKLLSEIDDLGESNHRYSRLAAERNQIQGDIAQLEEESHRLGRLTQTIDLAVSLGPRWQERAAIDEQLSALGPPRVMPEGAIERLDEMNAAIQKYRGQIDQLSERREELKREFGATPVNDALWRQSARIEALKEQQPWLAQLQSEIGELEKEMGAISSELAVECQRLGLGADPAVLLEVSSKRLSALHSPAKLLRQARRRWEKAKESADEATETAESLDRQMQSALTAHGGKDLAETLDRAGDAVAGCRRRIQIDQRLEQLTRHQAELEEQARQCGNQQLLPSGAIIGIGVVFLIGVVLVIAGLWSPGSAISTVGWTLAVMGLAGGITAIGGRAMFERLGARRLEAYARQLDLLRSQIEQTQADGESLDARLPHGGPIAVRLEAAQKELAAVEELAPLEGRRNAARQEADAADRAADEAQEQYRAARRRWRGSLGAAGLPDSMNAKQAYRLIERAGWVAATHRRLVERQAELARRCQELDSLTSRIVQLYELVAGGQWPVARETTPTELIHRLSEAVEEQEAAVARRDEIRREARRLRAAIAKREEAVARQKHRRRELLFEAGVREEQEFRQKALECARAEMLRGQREAISREISAALASHCSEEAIEQQLNLENHSAQALETRRNESADRLAAVEEQLRGLLEKRGRLAEQIDTIAADRRLASKHLDLGVLETRIKEAVHRWQVLAVACRILDRIRESYQRDRQPETLQEASRYLDRLTQGRYCRVWTPLGEHVLRVDDAEGNALSVESLSRGTREQLFLSLRLALASCYARRGAPLPLVLDDVLVNFDAGRAKAAAGVLRDFAAEGHQLLVFTCHEHISKMFKTLKAPVSQLPDNSEPGHVVVSSEPRGAERPKREKATRTTRRKPRKKPVEEEIDAEEDVEEVEDDDSLWDEDESDDQFDDDDAAAA